MTIWEYLKDHFHGLPEAGSTGVESGWIALGEIKVTQGSLWTGDPLRTRRDDGCMLQVPDGAYSVEAKGMDFNGHRRVARLRAFATTATSPALAEQIGSVSTDCTNIAICDVLAIEQFASGRESDFFEVIDTATGAEPGIIPLSLDGDTFDMAIVPSGFGDGTYSVFTLRENQAIAGIEVEFLKPSHVMEE